MKRTFALPPLEKATEKNMKVGAEKVNRKVKSIFLSAFIIVECNINKTATWKKECYLITDHTSLFCVFIQTYVSYRCLHVLCLYLKSNFAKK